MSLLRDSLTDRNGRQNENSGHRIWVAPEARVFHGIFEGMTTDKVIDRAQEFVPEDRPDRIRFQVAFDTILRNVNCVR